MQYREEANRIVVSAESSLRSIAEKALLDRAYGDVAHLAWVADQLRGLSERTQPGNGITPAPTTDLPPSATSSGHQNRRRPKAPTRRPRGYPRFERDGNKLVKIGWSKKHREEYEHRAPRDAVAAFARHLGGTVSEGHIFAVEDLMPVRVVDGDDEVPAYQVYLTLKWLQDVGAIEKKGRDGYALRNRNLSEGGLEEYWSALPEWKA